MGIMIGAAALVVIIAVLAVLLVMKPGSTSLVVKEGNFKTPEAAVEHFMMAVAKNDLDSALSACAVTEAAHNYDAAAFAERVKALTYDMAAPSEYKLYEDLNQALFLNRITMQIRNFVYSLVASGAANAVSQTAGIQPFTDPAADAARFVAEVDPAVLNGLTIKRVDLPRPDLYDSEAHQRNIKLMSQTYGADEATDRVMLLELNETEYYVGFTLLRYGEKWLILSLNSAIGETTPYGSAAEISTDGYLELVGG
jgi:hypothetical protein